MTMDETECLRARAEKAEAERDRLARVVSVMRGESEHLPEGWRVVRDLDILEWWCGRVHVSMEWESEHSPPAVVVLWGQSGAEAARGPDPLTMMEEADRLFPAAGGEA